YELAMLLVFFDAIPSERRTAVLTLYNLGNAVAIATGAFAGAAILGRWGETREVYLALFALSSAARLFSMAVLPCVPRRATDLTPLTRTLAVRPEEGSLERPVLAGAENAATPPVVTLPAREESRPVQSLPKPACEANSDAARLPAKQFA